MDDEAEGGPDRNDPDVDPDPDTLLDRAGFDAGKSVLTYRQAAVLALRERGVPQADIATRFGTSRANIANIEASARQNVEKARETLDVVEALRSPVDVEIEAGTDLYDVPPIVYRACDEERISVKHTAVDLIKQVTDAAGDDVRGREVKRPLLVAVTADGEIRVRPAGSKEE